VSATDGAAIKVITQLGLWPSGPSPAISVIQAVWSSRSSSHSLIKYTCGFAGQVSAE